MNRTSPSVPPVASFAFGLGMFSLGAQALLYRAYLVVLEGNELVTGVFFASWLIWVAAGAFIGRYAARQKSVLHLIDLIAVLLYPAALFFQRTLLLHLRELSGVQPYELFPVLTLLPRIFLFNLPVSTLTGFLFTLTCTWAAGAGQPVSRVYAFESLGAFGGGVVVTLLLGCGVTDENVLLVCTAALALSAIPAARYQEQERKIKIPLHTGSAAIIMIAALLLCFSGIGAGWSRATWRDKYLRLIPGAEFRGQFTTPQSRYLYGLYRNQFNVVSWESIVESYPAEEHAAEVTALTLAQAPNARRILVVGSGSYALCRKLLQLPQIERVTWLHPDPHYTQRLLQVMPGYQPEARLYTPPVDARRYLETRAEVYDLVIVNLPDPTTLILNRYFTVEFFQLLKQRLAAGGQVAVRASGGENVMGTELENIGASIYFTFQQVFGHCAIKPGDETWFIGGTPELLSESPSQLVQRLASVPGAPQVYPPVGLKTLYRPDRIKFQRERYQQAVRSLPPAWLLNRDRQPMAFMYTLLFALRHTVWTGRLAAFLPRMGTPQRAAGLLAVLLGLIFLLRTLYVVRLPLRPGSGRIQLSATDAGWLVLSTGFIGMASSIVLMFLLQARYGSLFLVVGLVTALFMLGIFVGGRVGMGLCRRYSPEFLLPLFLLGHTAVLLLLVGQGLLLPFGALAGAFLVCGTMGGLYIPAAETICRRSGYRVEQVGFLVEAADHAGGAAGGVAVSLFLVPVLGIGSVFLLLGTMLLTNLAVPAASLLINRITSRRHGIALRWYARRDPLLRTCGYFMAGTALAALLLRAALIEAELGEEQLREAAAALVPGAELDKREATFQGRPVTYFVYRRNKTGEEGFLVPSHQLAGGVQGYAGEIEMLLCLDKTGVLRDFVILSSQETPAYTRWVETWARRFIGVNLFQSPPSPAVDVLTGATLTSRAVASILGLTASRFRSLLGQRPGEEPAARRTIGDVPGFILAAFCAVAILQRLYPRSRTYRLALLVTVAGVLGWGLNAQYSVDHALMLLEGRLPPASIALGFLLVFLLPLVTIIAGNFYCGRLCPFGSIQELAERIFRPERQLAVSLKLRRHLRYVKFVILWLLVLLFSISGSRAISGADPLTQFFARSAGRLLVLSGLLLVIIGLFIPRFWCRYLCPAGAFLAFLSGLNPRSRRMWRIVPARCPYAVATADDLDCLGCDRCRQSEPVRQGPAPSRTAGVILIGLVLAGAAAIGTGALGHLGQPARAGAGVQPGARVQPAASHETAGTRKVDEEKVRRMIQRGALSDREALHYRRLEP